jgi:hypothetical protein
VEIFRKAVILEKQGRPVDELVRVVYLPRLILCGRLKLIGLLRPHIFDKGSIQDMYSDHGSSGNFTPDSSSQAFKYASCVFSLNAAEFGLVSFLSLKCLPLTIAALSLLVASHT